MVLLMRTMRKLLALVVFAVGSHGFLQPPCERVLRGIRHVSSLWATSKPQLIVFDLDGCLWKPELYELDKYRGPDHSPFQLLADRTRCRSSRGSVVKLLGANVLDELTEWRDTTQLAVSSRTGYPDWATELLSLLTLPKSSLTLEQAITGPWEIVNEPKVRHFERIAANTKIPYEQMVFFDNERGNCKKIAQLGVTACYCPQGLTKELFDYTMKRFPQRQWQVVGLDI